MDALLQEHSNALVSGAVITVRGGRVRVSQKRQES
jgi:hypothetical protein